MTVNDVIRLEIGVNIPVVKKLQPKLSELKSKAKFSLLRKSQITHYSDTSALMAKYINSWLASESCVQPTWRNFLTILRGISPDLCQVASQIKVFIDSCVSRSTTDVQDKGTQQSKLKSAQRQCMSAQLCVLTLSVHSHFSLIIMTLYRPY